jgi:purine-nucleoside phosphorylase
MTPHNSAQKEDIAPFVLLPGDPVRAAFVAHHFFDSPKEVTNVRGMKGYTGTFNRQPVSVLGSGMGGPSAGIYAWELFTHYSVQTIVRIGTCGGFNPQMNPGDLIFALTASTDSAWAHQYNLKGTFSPSADYPLLEKAVKAARKLQFPYWTGMVFSSDLFSSYNALGADSWRSWAQVGALAQDMETYALYCIASHLGKKALSILTMTDNCASGISVADDRRMEAALPMALVALELL